MVGISGGIDSLVLLFLLLQYNEMYTQKWDIKAVHIDPGFPGWNPAPMEKYLKAHEINPITRRTHIYQRIRKVRNRCFVCARERRTRLIETAHELGISYIALAHHQEDAAETLLLNMFFSGRTATCLPKQTVFHGRSVFIRPMYYLNKGTILEIANALELKSIDNSCPFYKDSRRERVREVLETLKKRNPDVYSNIFHSMFNIKNKYIPS